MINILIEKMLPSLGVGTIAFAIFVLTFGMYWWKQRMRLSIVFLRALFVAVAVGTMYYQLSNVEIGVYNFQVFADLRRVGELGYKAIWKSIASVAGPMVLVGFLLPLAFWKASKITTAAIVSLIMTAVYSGICFLLGGFDIDKAIYIFWGIVAGYSLIAFIAGLAPKFKYFVSVGFQNKEYIAGCIALMLTFFFAIAIFLMDNAVKILPLQFGDSPALPSDSIVMSASLSDDQEKIMVYQYDKPDLEKDAARIAQTMGITGSVKMEETSIDAEGNEKQPSFATVTEGEKNLVLYSAGNWTYTDDEAALVEGEMPSDEDADRVARQIASNGAIRGYDIYKVEVYPLSDGDKERTVFVYPQVDGVEIVSSCELKIVLGANGRIISVQKFDSEIKEFKKKNTISSSEAYEIVYNGGIDAKGKAWPMYHNLYQEATSINITDVNRAYWMEGNNGQLHPVWKINAMATLVDGSTTNFTIYVAAIDN